jgi:hypothetical protein
MELKNLGFVEDSLNESTGLDQELKTFGFKEDPILVDKELKNFGFVEDAQQETKELDSPEQFGFKEEKTQDYLPDLPINNQDNDNTSTITTSEGIDLPAIEKEQVNPQDMYATIPEDIYNEISKNKPENDFVGGMKVLGQSLLRVPKNVAASALQASLGAEGASIVNKGWANKIVDKIAKNDQTYLDDIRKKYSDKNIIPGISIDDVAQLPQNIGFSLASMSAGLGVGVPIALAPVPGARVAGYLAGSTASGKAAYEMATYSIMQSYLDLKNQEALAKTGKAITAKEEKELKKKFNAKAKQYGLWEAIPEAVSNATSLKLLAPLGKMIGEGLAKKVIGHVAGVYGSELLTETITQKGQAPIEESVGLRETGEGDLTWYEALKEVAPQTFLLSTIMAGAGATGGYAKEAIQKSLNKEIGNNEALAKKIDDEIIDNEKLNTQITPESESEIVPVNTTPVNTAVSSFTNTENQEITVPIDTAKKLIDLNFKGKEPAAEGEKQLLILTGGPAGAGKSTALGEIVQDPFVIANSDLIKKQAGYEESAPQFHEESSKIAKEVLEKGISEGYNVIYDSQLTNYDLADKSIKKVLANGGEADIKFTYIEPQTSRVRSLVRHETGENKREVPEEVIIKAHNRSLPTFLELYKQYKDNPNVRFTLVDNNVDFRDPVVIMEDNVIKDSKMFDNLLKTEYNVAIDKKGEMKSERKENITSLEPFREEIESRVSVIKERKKSNGQGSIEAVKQSDVERQPLQKENIKQESALAIIDTALASGKIDTGTHALAKHLVTEIDPEFDANSSLEIVDEVRKATPEMLVQEGLAKDVKEAAKQLKKEEIIISGETRSGRGDLHNIQVLKTSISLYKGHDADTLVEEWYHRAWDRLARNEQQYFEQYHRISKDKRSVREHFAQEGRDFFFSEKMHEKVGTLRKIFNKAKESLKALIARIRKLRGAKIPEKIKNMYRKSGTESAGKGEQSLQNLNKQEAAAYQLKTKPNISTVSNLETHIKSLRAKLRKLNLSEDDLMRRAELEIELKNYETERSEAIRQVIYDYARDIGLNGQPFNKIDTLLKNTKTKAGLERAIKEIDWTYAILQNRTLVKNVKEVINQEYIRMARLAGKRRTTMSTSHVQRLKAYLDDLREATTTDFQKTMNWFVAHPEDEMPENLLKEISKLFKTRIETMGAEELQGILNDIKLIKEEGYTVGEKQEEVYKQFLLDRATKTKHDILRYTKAAKNNVNIEKVNQLMKLVKDIGGWGNITAERILGYYTNFTDSYLTSMVFDGVWEGYLRKLEGTEKIFNIIKEIHGGILGKNLFKKGFYKLNHKYYDLKLGITEKIESFSLDKMMFFYANSKNSSNMAHLMGEHKDATATADEIIGEKGYSRQEIEEVIAHLPQKYKNAVDKMIDYYDAVQYKRMNEEFIKEHKVPMPKENGYFPLNTLTTQSGNNALLNDILARYGQRGIMKGMTKGRVQSKTPFAQYSYFETIGNNALQVEHYVNLNSPIREARRFLNQVPLRQAMEYRSADAKAAIDDWLKSVAYGKVRMPEDSMNKISEILRINFVTSILGGNLVAAQKTFASIFPGLRYVNDKNLIYKPNMLKAGLQFMWTPIKMHKFINNKSVMMRNRSTSYEREVTELSEKYFVRNALNIAGIFYHLQKKPMIIYTIADRITTNVLWYGKYWEQLSKDPQNEALAIKEADKLIRKTQSMGDIVSLPKNFRAGGFVKYLTTFKTDSNQALNILFEEYFKEGKTVKDKVATLLYAMMMVPFFLTLVGAGYGIKKLKNDPEGLIKGYFDNFLGGIPFLNNISNGLFGYLGNVSREFRGLAKNNNDWMIVSSIIPNSLSSQIDIAEGVFRGRPDKVITGGLKIVGLMSVPLQRGIKGVRDLASGKTDSWRRLIWSKSALDPGGKEVRRRRKRQKEKSLVDVLFGK